MAIKSLISIKMINDKFYDLTYIESVVQGWFLPDIERQVTRRILNIGSLVGYWRFADTGEDIDSDKFGLIIGRACERLPDNEEFFFVATIQSLLKDSTIASFI